MSDEAAADVETAVDVKANETPPATSNNKTCPTENPICFRKLKNNRKKTSDLNCQGKPLEIADELGQAYAQVYARGSDHADPTSYDDGNCELTNGDCFCVGFDYAWINYIKEAERQLGETENNIKKITEKDVESIPTDNPPLEQEIPASKVKHFYNNIIEKIIEVADKRWTTDNLKGDELNKKKNIITSLQNLNKLIDSSLDANETETKKLEDKEHKLEDIRQNLKDQINKKLEEHPDIKLTDDEINEKVNIIYDTLFEVTKKQLGRCNEVVKNIFEIGLYVLNDLDINSADEILEKLKTNLQDLTNEKISPAAVVGGKNTKRRINKKRKSNKKGKKRGKRKSKKRINRLKRRTNKFRMHGGFFNIDYSDFIGSDRGRIKNRKKITAMLEVFYKKAKESKSWSGKLIYGIGALTQTYTLAIRGVAYATSKVPIVSRVMNGFVGGFIGFGSFIVGSILGIDELVDSGLGTA